MYVLFFFFNWCCYLHVGITSKPLVEERLINSSYLDFTNLKQEFLFTKQFASDIETKEMHLDEKEAICP